MRAYAVSFEQREIENRSSSFGMLYQSQFRSCVEVWYEHYEHKQKEKREYAFALVRDRAVLCVEDSICDLFEWACSKYTRVNRTTLLTVEI